MKFQGVQLCKEYDPAKVVFPLMAEPKLDGYRLMACVDDHGDSVFHCRDEKPVDWQHNLRHIAAAIKAAGFRDCCIDGEVMAEDWNKTAIVKRKKLTVEQEAYLASKVKFHMFDLLHQGVASGWSNRERKYRFVDTDWYKQPLLTYVKDVTVHSHAQVLEVFQSCVARGYEGIVLKDPHAPYQFRRSAAWLKVKPMKTIEAVVTGLVAGKGKHLGRLGALECLDAQGQTFNVGTGFSDEQRLAFWVGDRGDGVSPVNSVVEVSAQDSAVGVIRNPTFVRFRPDRTAL